MPSPRILAGIAAALAVAACRSPDPAPPPMPMPVALPEATLVCPAQYAFDLASGALERRIVLGDGPLAMRDGVATPRPESRWVLLAGLGDRGPLAPGAAPVTVAVVNWSPERGSGSVDHVLALDAGPDGPRCLAAVALGDRERLLHVGVRDGVIALDGFTHAEGEPLASATHRVLAQLRFDGDPATPGTLRVRRQLPVPSLPGGPDRVAEALRPVLDPDLGAARGVAYAAGGDARVDARVFLPGPRAVELLLRVPATPEATATLERLLGALDPACAPPLAACTAAHRGVLDARVRFAWCECGTVAVAAWGRGSLQVMTAMPAAAFEGDAPWNAALGAAAP